MFGCVCANVNEPSAAVVPAPTLANPEESAGCHCRVTSRPSMHPGSAAIEPETVIALPKFTIAAEAESVAVAVSASAEGTRSVDSRASSTNASLRSLRPNVERAVMAVPPSVRAGHRATRRRRGQAPRPVHRRPGAGDRAGTGVAARVVTGSPEG